jgi:UDP-glucose-4-epimerase GalE
MRILVTGGAGYIGSVTTELLLSLPEPHDLCVVDDLSRGHRVAVSSPARLEVCSTSDRDRLRGILGEFRPEGVLHFAASSLVGESMRDPGLYFRNNVGGIVNLLDACVNSGCRKFLFSSSAATYGDPDSTPIREDAPNRPTNPYGQSKLVCEQILEWYRRIHGIAFGSLRYFNAAGASEARGEDHAEETHLIPLALRAALGSGPPLAVFGTDYPTPDGTCIRDYIHVLDLAEAHRLALAKLGGVGDAAGAGREPDEAKRLILNLGNGSGFSVLDVIRAVEKVVGRTVPWTAAPRRPGDPPRLVASSERAREILGWTPRHHSLDAIVESAFRWMKRHPDGYGDGEN